MSSYSKCIYALLLIFIKRLAYLVSLTRGRDVASNYRKLTAPKHLTTDFDTSNIDRVG